MTRYKNLQTEMGEKMTIERGNWSVLRILGELEVGDQEGITRPRMHRTRFMVWS